MIVNKSDNQKSCQDVFIPRNVVSERGQLNQEDFVVSLMINCYNPI